MPNERLIMMHEIIKYGCSWIFIKIKHYRMYIRNFSKVRSENFVDGDEIPAVEKGIH